MPRTGRPRKGTRDAIQAIFDQQFTRLLNKLGATNLAYTSGDRRVDWRRLRAKHRRRLGVELDGEATDFTYRK